jgi:putative peptidoglycan lipid II flippase
MSVATLASRVTGLARTWAMAFALGNTVITSAYQVANNMPNMIYDLVAGGLLNAAFIPLYLLQVETQGKEGGDRFGSNLLNIVIIIMGALSLAGAIFAPELISTQTFTVESSSEVFGYAVFFFRIFAFQMLFYGLCGVVTSILNAHRVYFLPSLAPAFNNIVTIASFICYIPLYNINPTIALTVLAVGTTLGVVVQLVVQIPALIRMGFKYVLKINFRDPAFIETVKVGIPMVVYILGTLVAFTCRNAFSLQTGDNGPSTLLYAWTWFQLPYGIIAVSLSRALFTEMSDAMASGDKAKFNRHLSMGLSTTLLLIIPLAGLMCVLAGPIMQIFRAGAFNASDVQYVGYILSLWVLVLPSYAIQMYLFNVYAAIRRFTRFAVVCVILCAVQCAMYALLCNQGALGLAGVPAADFIYYTVTSIILLIILKRSIGHIGAGHAISVGVRALLATAIGAGLAAVALYFLPLGSGILGGVLAVVIYGGVGLIIIFALCRLFRIPETDAALGVIGRIRKRFSR